MTARNVRIEWFIDRTEGRIEVTMRQRVVLAVKFLESRVVQNISRPVTKTTGPRGGRVVTDRSVPGEFPKADTTQLLKTIFSDWRSSGKYVDGFVGTPLDYGLILETRMDELFVAMTASPRQISSSALNTSRFASRRSTIASMTMPAWEAASSMSPWNSIRALTPAASSLDTSPVATHSSR